jgi:formate-dependent nitrite reductase cytochrome c552 subunit
MSRLWTGIAASCAITASLVSGCRESRKALPELPPPGTVAAVVDSATAARNATLEPGMLGTVQAIPVKGWTGPGGEPFWVARRSAAPEAGHARQFGSITLTIALRTRAASINQYPCSSCHQGRKVVMENKRIHDAHQNIQPVHPEQTGAVCSTCHSPDDVASLTLKSGERAPLDESYRLCGQCHFQQALAWAGGGHGKRLDGWEGRRVVMACPDCHDPHSPSVQQRIPFRAPQLERTRSQLP